MKKINESVIQDGFFAMKTAKGLQTAKTICNPFHIIMCYFHGEIVRQKSFASLPCKLTSAKILKNIVKNVHFGFAEITSLACGRTEFLNQCLNNFYLRS